MPPGAPMSRIAVTPWFRASSRRLAERTAVSAGTSAWSSFSGSGDASRQMCACAFMSPGVIVAPARSSDRGTRRRGGGVGLRADPADPAVLDHHVGTFGANASAVDHADVSQHAGAEPACSSTLRVSLACAAATSPVS